MSIKDGISRKWSKLTDKKKAAQKADPPETAPAETSEKKSPATVFGKIGAVFGTIGKWLYWLRKIFMAIPVVFCAIRLAMYNMRNLPEQVGLNLLATGEYAQMIDRSLAVTAPLAITTACLLLMFCSRKALHPWVISIFTLVLPLLLLLTNTYPK